MKLQLHRILLVAGVALVSAIATGCSSKITDEQKAKLNDLRQQQETLTRQLRDKETEQARIQDELKNQRAQLDQCNTNKKFVQDKLAQWPDVWPK